MTRAATITVRGSARATVSPSHLQLVVTARRGGTTNAIAAARLATTAEAVDAVLSAEGIEPADRQTTSVGIAPEYSWEDGRQREVGWSGTRVSAVVIRDRDTVGRIVAAVAAASDGVEVSGQHWVVADDHPAWAELRGAAAADARQRADTYARALGVSVVALRWLAEPGLRSAGGGPGPRPSAGAEGVVFRAAADAAPIPVDPTDLELIVAVEAAFELSGA